MLSHISFAKIAKNYKLPTELVTSSMKYEIFHFIDTDYQNMHNLPHWHHYYELVLVRDGNASIASNGTVYHIPNGSLAIVPPMLVHSTIISDRTYIYDRQVLHWSPDLMKPITLLMNNEGDKIDSGITVIRCDATQTARLCILLDQIQAEQSLADKYEEQIASLTIAELLLLCFRIRDSSNGQKIRKDTSNTVSLITEYIGEHYKGQTLSLGEIAAKFYLSEGHLLKLFRSYTGTTVYQYIIQNRILYAKDQMLMGKTIMQACLESGFSDYTAFLKSFKATFNKSPRQYMKEFYYYQTSSSLSERLKEHNRQ